MLDLSLVVISFFPFLFGLSLFSALIDGRLVSMDWCVRQQTIETKRYNLESAEGCYSMALMYTRDVKAKYAVKVWYAVSSL